MQNASWFNAQFGTLIHDMKGLAGTLTVDSLERAVVSRCLEEVALAWQYFARANGW